jgi:glycosyltransferase involved in cell wall biosynthesis
MLGTINHPHVEHLATAMSERGFDVVVGGNELPELPPSVLPAAGIRVHGGPTSRRSSLRGAAEHVRWIRRLLASERPDLVHAHWLCGFACFAALAGARPLVSMAWGSDVLLARRLQRLADRVALRRSALTMADSQTLIDACVALGADRRRCLLVQWGVDLQRFAPATAEEKAALRRELGLGESRIVLSPRSLMPVYNPRTILDAWAEVAAARDDVRLVLKHMGVRRGDLGELPFPDRVDLVGNVPYDDMPKYYRAADVCISIASSDSAPRSVFEAMACGTPCVLSDLPWVHEQIRDGEQALVVPIEAHAVAGATRRLLDEPQLARRVSESGRALVERLHDRAAHMDQLADAYRGLAA